MAQGRRSNGVQLIELGPGRGTLMDDILRTIATFKAFTRSIEGVFLVEAGEGLRQAQKMLLCGEEKEMIKTEMGWSCVSKYAEIPVMWVEDISLLPKDEGKQKIPFIIAHEFFDALPIHAFQSVAPTSSPTERQDARTLSLLIDSTGKPLPTSRQSSSSSTNKTKTATTPQWRELLVTPTPNPALFSRKSESATSPPSPPDFQLTLAKSSTPTSLLLPESSPRYRALKPQPGSTIEISPDSLRHIRDFALRIGGNRPPSPQKQSQKRTHPASSPLPSGAALIIDYGPLSTIPHNSLRAIQSHSRLPTPFSLAGRVDLSADVDFTALAEEACNASSGIEVWGPVAQGDFLVACGGEKRVGRLVEGLESGKDESQGLEEGEKENEKGGKKKQALLDGWKRLIDKNDAAGRGMGGIYKVLAVIPEAGGKRPPVGFGGGVVQQQGL